MNDLSLRDGCARNLRVGEILDVFAEIGREQNPLAAALGVAVMAEVGVPSMLRARLWIKDDDADNELFGSAGPVATSSQKIKVAEEMRIIGPATRANLDRVREIRNAFAHTHRQVTFETPAVVTLSNEMTIDVLPRRPQMPPIVAPRDKYVLSHAGSVRRA